MYLLIQIFLFRFTQIFEYYEAAKWSFKNINALFYTKYNNSNVLQKWSEF